MTDDEKLVRQQADVKDAGESPNDTMHYHPILGWQKCKCKCANIQHYTNEVKKQ